MGRRFVLLLARVPAYEMAQGTKDLAGMIGQVRGFDLDEFLADWESEGEALLLAIGDGSWVAVGDNIRKRRCPASLHRPRARSPLPR